MPGALLAVIGGELPAQDLIKMCAVSPYRGEYRCFVDADVALAVQSDRLSEHWHESERLVLGLHGYVHFADQEVGFKTADALAERYLRDGDRLWPALRGEFAVLLWDRLSRALKVYRDPMNGRFLHHANDHRRQLLATEVRQIRAVRREPSTLNMAALNALSTSYALPEPHSPFNEITRLQSGHCTVWKTPNAAPVATAIKTVLDVLDPAAAKISPADVCAQTERLVDQALRRTLGPGSNHVLLSGGLDSRLVYAAALKAVGSAKVQAVSHRFAQMDCDESATIAAVHSVLGTEGIYVDYDPAQFEASFTQMLDLCDYPVFLTSHLTAQLLDVIPPNGQGVVLGGFGGDEIFICKPRAMVTNTLATRWRWRREIIHWLASRAARRQPAAFLKDVIFALLPDPLYRRITAWRHPKRAQVDRAQTQLQQFVLKQKHSAHGFYGMLEQLSATRGLDLRMPFRDLDLCAFLQSIHPLGLLRSGDERGLEKSVLERYLQLPDSLTLQPKVNYTQVVELAVRVWPEMSDGPYRMEKAMKAFLSRFISRYSC